MEQIDKRVITPLLSDQQRAVLSVARSTYGETGQILVALEELCELAAVCAKYPRYDDKDKARQELHEKAVDEVADVLIVLDHIVSIFRITPEEVQSRAARKIERLHRWLCASDRMEQTTVDREVKQDCGSCEFMGNLMNLAPGHICTQCADHGGAYYKPKED